MRAVPAVPVLTACAALLLQPAPAGASSKSFGLTSFERVEVRGDMIVDIVGGTSVGAVAEGSREALETIDMVVTGRSLRISQRSMGAYGPRPRGEPPVRITLRAQNLAAVDMHGSGRLTAAGLRGPEVMVTLTGAGAVSASVPAGIAVATRVEGPGTITLSGRARSLRAIVSGAGSIDASALPVRDLEARSSGTGTSRFAASGRATVIASGAAAVEVAGAPRCTVRNSGAGTVQCGTRQRDALPTTAD